MKPCGCSVVTPLDKLCDECFNNAFYYAEVRRKLPEKTGHDYKAIYSADGNHVEQVRK